MATELSTDPDADVVMKIFHTGVQFWACARSVQSGIFDIIESHRMSGVTLEILVQELASERDITEKLLNTLVALQLLAKSADENGQWLYRNTEAARKYLTKHSSTTLIPLLKLSEFATYRAEKFMTTVLKTGSSKSFYSGLAEQVSDDQVKRQDSVWTLGSHDFQAGLDAFSKVYVPVVVRAFDLRSYKYVVDIGGGYGRLGIEFLKTYPEAMYTVFELPEVVSQTYKYHNADQITGIQFVAGDVFKDALPCGDLFILCHVIQNWPISAVRRILAKVMHAIAPGGALLVIEKGLSEDKTEPHLPVLLNLCCSLGGLDGEYRTTNEYFRLFEETGFINVQFKRIQGYNENDAFLAVKP